MTLVDELNSFIIDQWPLILIIVVIFITLLSVFSILDINFNPKKRCKSSQDPHHLKAHFQTAKKTKVSKIF